MCANIHRFAPYMCVQIYTQNVRVMCTQDVCVHSENADIHTQNAGIHTRNVCMHAQNVCIHTFCVCVDIHTFSLYTHMCVFCVQIYTDIHRYTQTYTQNVSTHTCVCRARIYTHMCVYTHSVQDIPALYTQNVNMPTHT